MKKARTGADKPNIRNMGPSASDLFPDDPADSRTNCTRGKRSMLASSIPYADFGYGSANPVRDGVGLSIYTLMYRLLLLQTWSVHCLRWSKLCNEAIHNGPAVPKLWF
jgi:hypothetical protein